MKRGEDSIAIKKIDGIIGDVIRSVACNCCFVLITHRRVGGGRPVHYHVWISDVATSLLLPNPPLWALVLCFAKPLSGRRLPSFQVDGTHERCTESNREASRVNARQGAQSRRFDEHRSDGCLSPRVVCRQRVKRITRNGRGNDWISEWNLPEFARLFCDWITATSLF